MLVFVTDYNVNINRQAQKSNIIQDKFTVAPPIEEKLMDTRLGTGSERTKADIDIIIQMHPPPTQ